MIEYKFFGRRYGIKEAWLLNSVAALVAITGLVTISSTLDELVHLHVSHIVDADAHTTLLAGLSLVYLATLLRKGKRTAWMISLPIFIFLLVRNIRHFDFDESGASSYDPLYFLNLLLPVLILTILIIGRQFFRVKSEVLNFATAIRRATLILLVAFLYGTIGFQLLDNSDFRQEIPLATGMHYTIDQFNLTTSSPMAYTKRAQIFLDSLMVIGLGALFYVGVSLFSPIRFKLVSHRQDYVGMKQLMEKYPSNSEDFFKLWPRDKAYYFSESHQAAVAYHTVGGSALIVGDPSGKSHDFKKLTRSFIEYCRLNDWQPAFIHTLKNHLPIYNQLGFESQKIGEEAIIDINNFDKATCKNKYFRHINNKFSKLGFICELLPPPHDEAVLARLKAISDDWLDAPGRSERGFMMGYFDKSYLNQCKIMVAIDASGKIQAFINQIPSPDKNEANFDLLRHSKNSLGNINDFLMLNFIKQLHADGFQKLNMGLSPLSGLNKNKPDRGMVDNLLHLIYDNSSRFYSFKGLRRFKEKYEPDWRERYIVYTGGLIGLSKTANNLLRAMRLK